MNNSLALAAVAAAFALASPAFAGPAEDLVATEKCNKCHTATTTKKGPSWASLAEKYKDKPEMAAKLATMLKTGMPLSGKTGEDDQHKKLPGSDADIKAVVALVLAAK